MTTSAKYTAILVLLAALAQRGGAQGTVIPASIAIDPAGRVVMTFSAMGAAARLDIGAAVIDATGKIQTSMRAPTTVAGAAVAASGVLVDARSVTLAGSNPGASTGSDIIVTRFPYSTPPATGIGNAADAPADFSLLPAYPNPVRGAAPVTVSFALAQAGPVRISLLDESGKSLAVLRDATLGPGAHTEQLTLGNIPAGVYFVEFRTGAKRLVQRVLLLR